MTGPGTPGDVDAAGVAVDREALARWLHMETCGCHDQPAISTDLEAVDRLIATGAVQDAATVAAQAWDEGYKTGRAQERMGIYPPADNPHREASDG